MQFKENQQCTAKSKRSGKQCNNYPMNGKNVCRMHGGKSTGPPKDNQNALIHGAYSSLLSNIEQQVIIEEQQALDNLDGDITKNAVMMHRGFILAKTPEFQELGLKLVSEALSRARKLKLARQELLQAKDSDENKPLPWVD